MLSVYGKLYAENSDSATIAKLVDLRASQAPDRGIEALQALASLIEEALRAARHVQPAAIIASQDLAYGLSRMYQAFSDEALQTVEVFRDPTEAIDWLNVDDLERRQEILHWFESPS